MDKSTIRKEMIKLRREKGCAEAAETSAASARLAVQFCALPEYTAATELFLYAPVNGEADTFAIARRAIADGKRIAFPISTPKSSHMDFYYVESLAELTAGFMNIPEPLAKTSSENIAIPSADSTQLMVMPLVAFDEARNRLGYGAGYYDTYLSTHGNNLLATVALAHDFQLIIEGIPSEPHDIKPEIIVTPTRVIR